MECTLLLLLLCVVPIAVADWGDLFNSARGRQMLAKEHMMAHAHAMPFTGSSPLASIHNFMHLKDKITEGQEQKENVGIGADWGKFLNSARGQQMLAKEHMMAHAQGISSTGSSPLATIHNFMHLKDKVTNNHDQKKDEFSGFNKVWRYHHDFEGPWQFVQHVAEHRAINDYNNFHMYQLAKQHQEWLNKEEEKKKFEQFKKLQEFHEEQHKRIADMIKWRALMKIHAQKEKEYQFGLLMKHFEDKQIRYVFETVFGLVKFCKCKDTINSMHKYLAPDGTKPANGTDSLFDFGADLESDWPNPWSGVLPKPKSTEEAKKMFFKGLVNTLCASAKTYVKHVKAMAAQINGISGTIGGYGMDRSPSGNGGNKNDGNENGGTGYGTSNGGNGGSLSERGFNNGNNGFGQTINVY